MSLRKKLYFGFLVMILLAVFAGAEAVWAFRKTDALVANAQLQVATVSDVLVPTNELVMQAKTDVARASLSFYAYSFNKLQQDYDSGLASLDLTRSGIKELSELMNSPQADILAGSREELRQSAAGLEALAAQAASLHSSMRRVTDLQKELDVELAETSGILDELYELVMADIKDSFADKETAGMTFVRQRMLESWTFLDDLYNAVYQAELLFWKGRGRFGEEAAAIFNEVEARITEQDRVLREFLDGGSALKEEMREKYETVSECLSKYAGLITAFSDEWNRSTVINAQMAGVSKSTGDTFDRLDELAGELTEVRAEDAHGSTVAVDDVVERSMRTSLVILIATVLVGGFLAHFITQGIVGPINAVIRSLAQGGDVIEGAASQIESASRDLSEGVTSQVSSLEETTSALAEMSEMTRASAVNAKSTNESAIQAAGLVRGGADDMKEMSAAMAKINEQADRISHIIKTIEEIAFQTNLLALNAAVEAARAGEAGKGFAVVADEVRNLSGRSAQAAKDTAELITATVESVRTGSGILDRLSGSYGGIETSIGGIQTLIGQIAEASEEQSQGVEQINTAVSRMSGVTQQNAAGAEESAASVENLSGQVSDLRGNIAMLRGVVAGRKISRNANGNGNGRKALPPSRRLTAARVMIPEHIE